jgi:tetratricopeptide (TPR) repeat protein
MARKVTKKEMEQQDFIQATSEKLSMFISRHKFRLYVALGIFASMILVATGWYLYRQNYEANAQKLYAKAYIAILQSAMQGINPDQNVLKMYQDVVTQYPGTKAARSAHYQLGNLFFNLGDYDASLRSYQEFLKDFPDNSDLRTLAQIGVGYCYEAKKDFDGALKAFQNAVGTKTSVAFEGIIYRDIARIYEEMNDKKKALEYYYKALNTTSDPSTVQLIKRKISFLG